jgi:hypothetical protein
MKAIIRANTRLFSNRVKGQVDWSKMTKQTYFNREITENPEFFKAFP